MPTEQLANLAQTTIASAMPVVVAGTSETIQLASVESLPSEPQYRLVAKGEIMLVTAMNVGGNPLKLTVVRGSEATTPAEHAIGDTITCVLTKGAVEAYVEQRGGEVLAGAGLEKVGKTLNANPEKKRAEEAEALKAPLLSPALTGTPTAPTAAEGDNSTKLATTAYTDRAATEAEEDAVEAATTKVATEETARKAAVKEAQEKAEAASIPLVQKGAAGGVPSSVEALAISGKPASGQVLTATSASAAHWATGGSGITEAEAKALIAAEAVALAPKASGDETGATDTKALKEAQEKGPFALWGGPYYVTELPEGGPETSIFAVGKPVVFMVGSGTCLRVHNPSMSKAGGEAEFIKNMAGYYGDFVIDGSKASGTKAIGLWVGDINSFHCDLTVRAFTGTESKNVLFKSEVAWCERVNANIVSINSPECVCFDNGGTATGAFDYSSNFNFSVQAKANQHALVMQNGVGLWGCGLRLTGNCFTGVTNTGVGWKIGADGSQVQVFGTRLDIGLETDGTSGVGHKTIELGSKAEVRCGGGSNLSFREGGTIPWVSSGLTSPNVRFSSSGYHDIDEAMGKNHVGEGLNVFGGSSWSKGATTVTGGNVELGVNGGDYFAGTLANGANVIKLNNVVAGRARTIRLVSIQPASGEAGTLTWTEPGNNSASEAQSINWAGGGGTIPTQSANGATDVFELFTYDGRHWYATAVSGTITANQIASEAVTAGKIKNEAVETTKIANGAVTLEKLASEAVGESKIKNEAVVASKIKNEQITLEKLASEAVGESKIKAEAVSSSKIKKEAVTEEKIINGAVTIEKLGAESVGESKIKAKAVTAAKIAANAVEAEQIKAEAVGEGKLAKEAVATEKIKSEAVTLAKLAKEIKETGAVEIATAAKVEAEITESGTGNGEKEPSATKPTWVYVKFKAKESASAELKIEVAGVSVYEWRETKLTGLGGQQTAPVLVPKAAKIKVTFSEVEKIIPVYHTL